QEVKCATERGGSSQNIGSRDRWGNRLSTQALQPAPHAGASSAPPRIGTSIHVGPERPIRGGAELAPAWENAVEHPFIQQFKAPTPSDTPASRTGSPPAHSSRACSPRPT